MSVSQSGVGDRVSAAAPLAMPCFLRHWPELRQSPLFRVAAGLGSLVLSRLTGYFHLAGYLGYEFEDSVFGVVRLDRGGFAVS